MKTASEIAEYFSKDRLDKLEAISQIKAANDFYVEKMKEALGDKKHISLKSLAHLCENITCYTDFTNEVQSLFGALDSESVIMTTHNYADFKHLRDFEKEQLDMKPLIFDNQKMQFSSDTPFGERAQGIIDSFLAKIESKKNLLFTNTIDGCNLGNLVSGKLKLISMLPGVHFVNKDNFSSEADIPKFINNLKTIVDKMGLIHDAFDSLLKLQLKIINQTRKNLDFKEMTKDFPEKLVQKLETDHKVLLTSIKTFMLAYSKIISVVIRTGTVTPLLILRLAIKEMNLAKNITNALIEKSDEFINAK